MATIPEGTDTNPALACLREANEVQRAYLRSYEKACEPVAYETLRTFDDLFCRDLMEPERSMDQKERTVRDLSTWGVNHALRRVIPKTPTDAPFREFPSNAAAQSGAPTRSCTELARLPS
jgi:hypothetical protein